MTEETEHPHGLMVVVQGSLQCRSTRVEVRRSVRRDRVYVRSDLLSDGMPEWQGELGQEYVVRVLGTDGVIFGGPMVLRGYAVGQAGKTSPPVVRMLFERVTRPDGTRVPSAVVDGRRVQYDGSPLPGPYSGS